MRAVAVKAKATMLIQVNVETHKDVKEGLTLKKRVNKMGIKSEFNKIQTQQYGVKAKSPVADSGCLLPLSLNKCSVIVWLHNQLLQFLKSEIPNKENNELHLVHN